MQEKNARIESKEDGEIAKGDIAVIDFKDSLMMLLLKVEKARIIH